MQSGMGSDEALDRCRAMRPNRVPEEKQGTVRVTQQLPEECDYLPVANRAGVEAEVTLAPQPHGRKGRQLRPVKTMPENRRVPTGSPSLGHIRGQGETGFVDEKEGCTDLLALFFIAGQTVCSQCCTFRSSRSRARRSGRCQENPRRCSSRQT